MCKYVYICIFIYVATTRTCRLSQVYVGGSSSWSAFLACLSPTLPSGLPSESPSASPSGLPSVINCLPDECHSILLGETETVVFRSWQYIRIECVWYQHTGGRGIIRHAREPSVSSHLMSMYVYVCLCPDSRFKLQGLSPRPVKMQVRTT